MTIIVRVKVRDLGLESPKEPPPFSFRGTDSSLSTLPRSVAFRGLFVFRMRPSPEGRAIANSKIGDDGCRMMASDDVVRTAVHLA